MKGHNIQPLIDWIKSNNIKTPVKLEIGLDKLRKAYPETRYFTIRIEGHTVTQMVANAIGRKMSKDDSMIVHGGGMDMGFDIQNRLYNEAFRAGYPNMFDDQNYKYLGKLVRGKYTY